MDENTTPVEALKHCDFVTNGLCDPDVVKPLYEKRRIDFGHTFRELAGMSGMNQASLSNLFRNARWVRPVNHMRICAALHIDPRTLVETKPAPSIGGLE